MRCPNAARYTIYGHTPVRCGHKSAVGTLRLCTRAQRTAKPKGGTTPSFLPTLKSFNIGHKPFGTVGSRTTSCSKASSVIVPGSLKQSRSGVTYMGRRRPYCVHLNVLIGRWSVPRSSLRMMAESSTLESTRRSSWPGTWTKESGPGDGRAWLGCTLPCPALEPTSPPSTSS